MCLVMVTSHSSEFLTASSALANALLGAGMAGLAILPPASTTYFTKRIA